MIDIHQKPSRPLVSVSILSADFGHMIADCQDVLSKGGDLLHIDVMDGHFAPNLTMGGDMIRALRKHLPDTYLDVHLMVEKPEMYIEAFAKAGANMFSFHLEVCHPLQADGYDANDLISQIKASGMHAGMVINPDTPAEGLLPYLDQLDLVLVMSVVPGKSGQSFMPRVLEKTKWLSQNISPRTRLEMDGGLNSQTAQQAKAAGVDVIVAASAIFGSDDRAQVIQALSQPI